MKPGRKPPVGGQEGGQLIVVFAIVLLVLLGFAALGIDVGYMYSVRNDLQRSADSGALAGAYVFNDYRWLSGSIPATLRNKAVARATDFATRDPVGAAPLPSGAVTVTFPPGAVNQIQVDVQDTVNLFFAGIIGSPTVTLTATARAEAVQVRQNVECLKPLAVPLPYVDRDNNDRRDHSNETISYNCGPGTLCQGTRLLNPRHLRIVDDSSISVSDVRYNSGRLFALDMCGSGGVGNSTYQNWIQSRCTETCGGGTPFVADIGDRIRLRNNQSDSPTRAGLQALISGDNNGATFNYDSVNYPGLPGSNNYNGDNWINSPRVIRVVLYDPGVVAGSSQTDTRIPVWGFAGFWINRVYRRQTGTTGWPYFNPTYSYFVDGYLIPDSVVGTDPIIPPSIEPSLKTTRLVQ
jgi:Putative Flp pilus-assembly TadE/G-like